MLDGVQGGAFAVIDGTLYVAGGYFYRTSLFAYDIAGRHWYPKASLPVGMQYAAGAALDGKFWVYGGQGSNGYKSYIYDPATNNWTNGPDLNVYHEDVNGATVGRCVALVGGSNGNGYISNVELVANNSTSCGQSAAPTATRTPRATNTRVRTATRTRTSIPGTATNTRRPTITPRSTRTPTRTITPGGVATATAAPCAITFTDVRNSDFFYQGVRYLACHTVISGYGDGSFRPFNNTTRSQMVKIIVLAEGIPLITPVRPTFSDVPTDSPFFSFVETAVTREVISGYNDGTFKPFNNITRGQLCKVLVIAADWDLVDPVHGTFSDTAPENPFYVFIETAARHGVISGYGDGTFRWQTNATRGQIAKIVYLSVTGSNRTYAEKYGLK